MTYYLKLLGWYIARNVVGFLRWCGEGVDGPNTIPNIILWPTACVALSCLLALFGMLALWALEAISGFSALVYSTNPGQEREWVLNWRAFGVSLATGLALMSTIIATFWGSSKVYGALETVASAPPPKKPVVIKGEVAERARGQLSEPQVESGRLSAVGENNEA